jgi:hypothetical protein
MGRGLSELQKAILGNIYDRQNLGDPDPELHRDKVGWGVGVFWCGRNRQPWTAAQRVTFSRALVRLEERGLVFRHRDWFGGGDSPTHTRQVSLTNLGRLTHEALAARARPKAAPGQSGLQEREDRMRTGYVATCLDQEKDQGTEDTLEERVIAREPIFSRSRSPSAARLAQGLGPLRPNSRRRI